MSILRQKPDDHYNTYTIYQIIQNSAGILIDLSISVDDTDIAPDHLVKDLWMHYTGWIYPQLDLNHYEYTDPDTQITTEIDGGYIYKEWDNWIALNGLNLLRMLDALFAEYDPIANYDMFESGSDGDTEDTTHTTPKGKTHTDITPYATGINSTGDGAKQGKQLSETYFSDNAESEYSHDHTKSITDNDGSTVSGFWKTHAHYFKRHGNIGVTSSAQLIGGELELRTVDLIDDFVKRFMMHVCYYVGGDR